MINKILAHLDEKAVQAGLMCFVICHEGLLRPKGELEQASVFTQENAWDTISQKKLTGVCNEIFKFC